jgi:hypothetical protein
MILSLTRSIVYIADTTALLLSMIAINPYSVQVGLRKLSVMGHLLLVIGHWLLEGVGSGEWGVGSGEWGVGSGDLIFDAQAGASLVPSNNK